MMRHIARGIALCVLLASPALAGGSTAPGIVQSGAVTAGHCAQFSASGVAIDAGATCGTGTAGVSQFSGGTTGLTPSSATSGAITLSGTLAVANGGTGASSAGITALNNITGQSYSGFSGTGNLLGSANPTVTGSFTATGLVTNADLANSSVTIAGNSLSLGASLTATTLTASLNQFSSSLQGLVPASGGGTTNFLRADGTWAAPPGSGGSGCTTSGASILYGNGSGGCSNVTIGSGLSFSAGTLSATGGGSSPTLTQGNGISISTSGSACSSCTIAQTVSLDTVSSGFPHAIQASDGGAMLDFSSTSASSATIAASSTSGYGVGFGVDLQNINSGTFTLTATTSTFDNGASTLSLAQGQHAFTWGDGFNYHSALSLPVMAADTLLGNFSGTANYPVAGAVPNCANDNAHALIYSTSSHSFSCQSITGSGGGGSGTVNSGTSGQVAYYASTGTAVSGEDVSQLVGAKVIASGTISSATANLSLALPSGYRKYRLEIWDLDSSGSTNQYLNTSLSANGGSSYYTGSSDVSTYIELTGSTSSTFTAPNSTIELCFYTEGAQPRGNLVAEIDPGDASHYPTIKSDCMANGGGITHSHFSGYLAHNVTVNYIQLTPSDAGNITSLRYVLWGVL